MIQQPMHVASPTWLTIPDPRLFTDLAIIGAVGK
jgi:hypothetical protein